MKKFAIGCGIVVLVLGVAGVIASYYVFRQVQTTVGQFAELGSVPEIEQGITNQTAFDAPASGALTADQVERLLRVQTRIRGSLGERFADFEGRYKTLLEKEQATALDLPQMMGAYRDLAASWVEAKRVQVAALNESNFSLSEYRWVRDRAYEALGMPIIEVDVSRIMQGAQTGADVSSAQRLAGSLAGPGSEPNRALVEPYRKQLEDLAPLAVLGL